MATVAPPIMITVIRNVLWRPTRPPRRPKISAPIGRKKKPVPNRARAASRPAVESRAVKKFLAMTGVRAPKAKKSYHSKVVPSAEAATTVRMEAARPSPPVAGAPVSTIRPVPSLERVLAGDGAPQDQGVDVVGAFVGVDRLQVRGVAHDMVLAGDAVAAVHIPRDAGNFQRFAAVVALHQADRLGNPGPLVDQAAKGQGALIAERDLGHHVGELLLHQLARAQRSA